MSFFLAGVVLLGAIWGLYWLKDKVDVPILDRIAYHPLTVRLTIIAGVMILAGLMMAGADLLARLGLHLGTGGPAPG